MSNSHRDAVGGHAVRRHSSAQNAVVKRLARKTDRQNAKQFMERELLDECEALKADRIEQYALDLVDASYWEIYADWLDKSMNSESEDEEYLDDDEFLSDYDPFWDQDFDNYFA